MMALRSYFSNLFSKPFRRRQGGSEPVFLGSAGALQLRWKLVIGCWIVSAVLLCTPQMRQALSAVVPTWKAFFTGNFRPYPKEETARWQRIGREAEARGDAAAMAFAAMRLADPAGKYLDDAVRLAR
jgi:hypothetical protein